jgi:carboxypeptidase PM20D1
MGRATTRLLAVLGASFALVAGITVVETARYDSVETQVGPASRVGVSAGAAERLAGALRIPTISSEDPAALDGHGFKALHAYLEAAFPRVHAQLRRETVGTHSPLYTWEGSDPSLAPILLAGHMDVVPVDPGAEDEWHEDPFGGRIVDGFIWGRGAIDNKSGVVGTLEAVDLLLGERFQPVRTVYLAFGHDEEVGGTHGARAIAALLKSRGIELEMVLDEGGVIGDGILPGVAAPVALVGIAEKGFVTVDLTTRAGGGHSSLPPRQSAVGIVSAAVARLERSQMPARLDGPTRELFDHVAPRFALLQRALFANLWLTSPIVVRRLERSPTTNAMVRTTTAPTMFRAGTKDNVLPASAKAVVNFRILPGDSVAAVLEHVKRVVDDRRIEITIGGRFSSEPSPVSSTDSESYRRLQRTIRAVVPDAVVAPYLVVVVTDARYYGALSRNVFRFLPLRLTSADVGRMHGTDERVGIREYEDAIRVYRQLVIDAAGASPQF